MALPPRNPRPSDETPGSAVGMAMVFGVFATLLAGGLMLDTPGLASLPMAAILGVPALGGLAFGGLIALFQRVAGPRGVGLANRALKGSGVGMLLASAICRLFLVWSIAPALFLGGMLLGAVIGATLAPRPSPQSDPSPP